MFPHIYPNWGAEVCGVRINNLEGDLQADTPLFRVGGIPIKYIGGSLITLAVTVAWLTLTDPRRRRAIVPI